ncbi:MAG TPA: hypothetical protein VGI10_06105 [Polyangiaceae bacterium]
MNALSAGVQLAWTRARTPSLPLLLAASAALAVALVHFTESSLDAVLEGPVLGWTLPIVGYLIAQRVTDNQRLDHSLEPLARHGADRRRVAVGLLLVSAALSALTGGLLAIVTVSAAHEHFDAAWLRDLAATTLVASAAGLVYATWFWGASTIGRRGGGRLWALAGDLVLGAGSSLFALPFPRSHLRNLLGGLPPAGLSQRAAWLAFAILSALTTLNTLRRLPR